MKKKDAAAFVYADAHCDTVQVVTPWRLACGNRQTQLDFPRLIGRAKLQFMAHFLGADVMKLPAEEAWRRLRQQQLDLHFAVSVCPDVEMLLDLGQAGKSDKVQLVAALEGLDFLAGDYRKVDDLYAQGFRSFGLFWNNDNFLGSGALTCHDRGLTGAGRELVRKLAQEGRLVDLAHASERSFWQAADILAGAGRSIFVSHSCAGGLCKHPRNLTDEQIKAVGDSGGVIGVALVPQFLQADGMAQVADFAHHAAYMAKIAGEKSVVLGSDFDGTDTLPCDIGGVQDMDMLYQALLNEGFSRDAACGIMGNNLLEFLRREA